MQSVPLCVCFSKPGFFLNDPRLTVRFDGHVIYEGSFLSGFETTFPVAPGTPSLAVKLTTSLFSREKQYSIAIEAASGYRAQLEYSRLWGNFKSAPRLTRC